jgi:transcriptional regulator with XRE-family HTH domain
MGVVRTKITIEVIDHEETGAVVRRARKKARLVLRDVAAKTGLSTAYIANLETGNRAWTNGLYDTIMTAITELT